MNFGFHLPLAAVFSTLDVAVLVAYLVITVCFGIFIGRGQKSLGDYFVGGRKMSGLLVCISIVATDFSAVGFLGVPAWVFERDLRYHTGQAMLMIPIMITVALVFVPIYHRLGVYTVFEYLEHRYHPSVRSLAALLFIFQRGVWMSVALVAPSIALTTITGIPVWVCILCLGVITTLYTTRGGIKADICTDCLQFVVMVGGLFLMIGTLLAHFNWDLSAVWQGASASRSELTNLPHTTMFDFRFDFKTEATFWSLLFFLSIYNIGTYGTDQVVAQRYFTMGGLRAVVRTVILSGFLSCLITISLVSLGLVLTAYMHDNPTLAAQISGRNRLVPHFILNHLPVGIRGLLIASLFAATMATVNSGINSTAAVAMMDLYKRYSRKAQALDDRQSLWRARLFSMLIGVLVMVAALWLKDRQANVVQTVVQFASKFIGPITGIFFLGILTKRGNVFGAFLGAAAGLTVSFGIELEVVKRHIHWLWTAPLSSLTTFLVGYIASLATPQWQLSRTQKEVDVAEDDRTAAAGAVEVGS